MKKIAIAVHGGAGPDSENIKKNFEQYQDGIKQALAIGHQILANGGRALDAVEAAVNFLEDHSLFNAGRGSALNAKAEVEMCASIMDGSNKKSGAVTLVRNVKNPVSLARAVMDKTEHVFLGSEGAEKFAQDIHLPMEPDAYFITEHMYEMYKSAREKQAQHSNDRTKEATKHRHGTVGAVALDEAGNIAAATSTGGTEFCMEGRIGDSPIMGCGIYANNETCAVSATGDGEFIIQNVIAYDISAAMEYKGYTLQEACHYILQVKNANTQGDMGIIAVDTKGNIAVEFNSERMHRGWKAGDEEAVIKIYK